MNKTRLLRLCARLPDIHSIQIKMFFICVVISNGILLLTSQLIIQQAAGVIVNNAYDYIHESVAYADSNFSIMLEDAMAISLSAVSSNDIVIEALRNNFPEPSFEYFKKQRGVEDFLSGLVANKSHITMAAIIGTDGRSYRTGGNMMRRSIIEEPWFHEASKIPSLRIFYNTPTDKRIFLCRPITYNRDFLGVSVIEMNYDTLSRVYSITPLEQVEIVTFSQDGLVVFSNRTVPESFRLKDSYYAGILEKYMPDKRIYMVDGRKMLVAVYTSPINQLTTIGLVSYDQLLTEALSIRRQMIYFIVGSTLVATIASWLFAQLICRNLLRLQESMGQVQKGNLTVRAEVRSRDEIGILAGFFNTMMDHIEGLMRDIKYTEEQKRQAEQSVLETQIQPHFIYNILNSITYVAHMRAQTEIEEVSAATVQLLRGVLNVRQSFIPIWQECDYITQYLKIQRFKQKQDFAVSWDVEEALWNYRIPKLILQPVIENALLHGISQKENGRITVQISREDEMLIMKVTDNGRGITNEEIARLFDKNDSGTAETQPQFRKVGFSNVHERIQMIYGKQYGAKVSSFPQAFTCVELMLPWRKEDI